MTKNGKERLQAGLAVFAATAMIAFSAATLPSLAEPAAAPTAAMTAAPTAAVTPIAAATPEVTATLAPTEAAAAAPVATPTATTAPATEPAPEAAEGPRTVDVPVFDEDRLLTLPRNTAAFWFPVPGGTRIASARLRLFLSASDTLIEEKSTMTAYLNGDQLATTYIPRVASNGGLWTVDIPSSSVRADGSLNELKLVTAQRSIEGDCADIDNPANWVKLLKASALRLTVEDEGAPALSGLYTRFFDSLENTGALSAEFVLGGAPGDAAAMLRLSAAVGGTFPYRDAVAVSAGRDETGAAGNVIRLGGGADALPTGTGSLAVSHSGGVNRLVLDGGDAEGFEKAVSAAANPDLLALMDASQMTIESVVPEAAAASVKKESGYYTLADFGYDTVNLAGAFHQEASFALPQPGGLISGDNSYVEIRFRHSEALLSDNSLLTVYVGGVPLASAKLSASNADGGVIKARIPSEALEGETIQLRVEVYNYLGRVDCSKDYYDTAWTVIDKTSVVYLEPGEQAVKASLSGFPTLPAGNTVVVVPEGANEETLSLAAALAVRAGQANGRAGAWRVTTADELAAPDAGADYIFLTDTRLSALPEAVSKALPISPEGGGYRVSAEVGVVSEALLGKAVFQAIRSPWNFDRRAYVITYPEGGEKLAMGIVERRSSLNNLSGQVAVSAGSGATALKLAGEPKEDSAPLTVERIVYLIETRTGYPIEALAALAAALVVILILIVRSMRNRSRFSAAAKDVTQKNREAAKPKEEESAPADETRQKE